MQIKLPTVEIKLRRSDVSKGLDKRRSALPDLDLRGRASGLRDLAVERAGGLREMATERAADFMDIASDRASGLRDMALDGAAGLRDAATDGASGLRDLATDSVSGVRERTPDIDLPEVHLPDVHLPDLPSVDVGKAMAPTAKAVGEGIEAVAQSFRSIGKGIEQWRKPKKQQPPLAETGVALLAGIGGGMALMFFLDPAKGRRRRSLLRGKLTRWSRVAAETFESARRGLADRSKGLASAIPSIGRDGGIAIDEDTQADVASGPDVSGELEAVDEAAGHQPEASSADAQPAAATGADGSWVASGTGIYGRAWGEAGSSADDAPVEERERIVSAQEG